MCTAPSSSIFGPICMKFGLHAYNQIFRSLYFLFFLRTSNTASNFHGGLPKESLGFDQPFHNNLMKTDFLCTAI